MSEHSEADERGTRATRPARPRARAGAGGRPIRAAALLAAATLVNYLAWLGWDQRKDVQPDGTETGPYHAWQIAGLVLVLGALTVAAAWRGHPTVAAIAITAAMIAAYAVDAATETAPDANPWPIGAVLLGVGTLLGTGVTAAVTAAVRRRLRRPVTTG
jgi:hypothetical protein